VERDPDGGARRDVRVAAQAPAPVLREQETVRTFFHGTEPRALSTRADEMLSVVFSFPGGSTSLAALLPLAPLAPLVSLLGREHTYRENEKRQALARGSCSASRSLSQAIISPCFQSAVSLRVVPSQAYITREVIAM
jgi:hypothetical protein